MSNENYPEKISVGLKKLHEAHDYDSFQEAVLELYKNASTRKLEKIVDIIAKQVKTNLESKNLKFKLRIKENERLAQMEVERSIALHKGDVAESKIQAKIARSEADRLDKDVAGWIEARRIKILTPQEAEDKLGEKLYCPICKKEYFSDKVNILDGEPTCFEPNCWHRLVQKDELRNYNRTYRRQHIRNKLPKKEKE